MCKKVIGEPKKIWFERFLIILQYLSIFTWNCFKIPGTVIYIIHPFSDIQKVYNFKEPQPNQEMSDCLTERTPLNIKHLIKQKAMPHKGLHSICYLSTCFTRGTQCWKKELFHCRNIFVPKWALIRSTGAHHSVVRVYHWAGGILVSNTEFWECITEQEVCRCSPLSCESVSVSRRPAGAHPVGCESVSLSRGPAGAHHSVVRVYQWAGGLQVLTTQLLECITEQEACKCSPLSC